MSVRGQSRYKVVKCPLWSWEGWLALIGRAIHNHDKQCINILD